MNGSVWGQLLDHTFPQDVDDLERGRVGRDYLLDVLTMLRNADVVSDEQLAAAMQAATTGVE